MQAGCQVLALVAGRGPLVAETGRGGEGCSLRREWLWRYPAVHRIYPAAFLAYPGAGAPHARKYPGWAERARAEEAARDEVGVNVRVNLRDCGAVVGGREPDAVMRQRQRRDAR